MSFIRNCPICNRKITHKNQKGRDYSEKHKKLCRVCTQLQPETLEKNKKANSGERNAMYGKSMYDAWLVRYGEEKADKLLEEYKDNKKNEYEKWVKLYGKEEADKKLQTKKYKCSVASSGEKNPMFNKSFYDVWVDNFGEKEAEKRELNRKKKLSLAASGENNPMFGKPAPPGSGNGWKGWHKGIYFASLREFFYLKYLLDNNIKFENGEKKKFKVSYEFMDKKRNYFLDFYLPETDQYIEIKPIKLLNSPRNTAKFKAAKEIYGEKFKVLSEDDIQKPSLDDMYKLYLNKDLVFMDKYEQKFLDYYQKHRKEI